MNTSIFLAKVFGIYLIIISVILWIRKDSYRNLLLEFMNNPGIVLLVGIITLIIGTILIVVHNIWVFNWPVIITLFGWLTFLTGIFRILFVEQAIILGRKFLANNIVFSFFIIFNLIIGIILFYLGYFS